MSNHIWVAKGWGGEEILVNNNLYCGKILHVMQGKKCSWHYHKIKNETFYVQKGRIRLEYWGYGFEGKPYGGVTLSNTDEILAKILNNEYPGDTVRGTAFSVVLKAGDTFDMPVGCPHRFTGLSNINRMFEFSTHDEPSDSYRLIKGD